MTAFSLHRLEWDGCRNIRDVGAYRTADGARLRSGALLRSDNLCRMTPTGTAALVEYGVRTIIDLRTPTELRLEPHPFAADLRRPDAPRYLNISIMDEANHAGVDAVERVDTSLQSYIGMLEYFGHNFAAAIRATATAAPGGVLVHCHAGKDRTGLLIALLLHIAGVPEDTIVADYVASDEFLQPLYAEILTSISSAERRAVVAGRLPCRPETMRGVFAHLHAEHDGVEPYLLRAGLRQSELSAVRERLVAPDAERR